MSTGKKKILVIAEVFYPEDFLINDLVAEWVERGYDLEVMARVPSYPFGEIYDGYKNKWYQKDSFHGITVHRLPFVSGYKSSVFLKILNYLLFVVMGTFLLLKIGRKFSGYFIYHTGPLTLAIPGIIAKKVYDKTVTIWTQDLWPDTVYAYGFSKNKPLEFFLSSLVSFVYGNCKAILITCPGFKKRIRNYVSHDNIITAPNWPITEGISNGSEAQDIQLGPGFNFTFTGNVGKVQNLENVIKGFDEFQKQQEKSATLNIVGDGSHLDRLKSLARENNIQNVRFWGRYPLNTMPQFYQQSDALLLSLIDKPIYELTIPLKFQTYLTAAKPVYGIIKGDVAELVQKNHIGLTALPSSIEDISNKFAKFLELSEDERADMGEKANELLLEKFSRSVVVKKITETVFGN